MNNDALPLSNWESGWWETRNLLCLALSNTAMNFQVGVNRLDRGAKPQHSELRFCKDANGSVTNPREKCCNLIGLQPDLTDGQATPN